MGLDQMGLDQMGLDQMGIGSNGFRLNGNKPLIFRTYIPYNYYKKERNKETKKEKK